MERMPLCHCWKPAVHTLTFLLLQSLVLIKKKTEKQSLKPAWKKGQSVLRQTHMFLRMDWLLIGDIGGGYLSGGE